MSSDLNPKLKQALLELEEQRKKLNEIEMRYYSEYSIAFDGNGAIESVKRWRERTARLLGESVSATEARKLCQIAAPPLGVRDSWGLKDWLDKFDAFLLELIQDILEHPDELPTDGGVMGSYDVAQICLNGHVANDSSKRFPQSNKAYCDKCGEKTITSCPKCAASIRGEYHAEGVLAISHYSPPAFCHNCGTSFPWTERAMQAAIELAVESGDLNEQEQGQFSQSVGDITRDTPKAGIAGSRVAKLLGKMGKTTADAVRDILVDIASETAKKMIWPDK